MKQVPNLYSFATKELAQDATIAYMLSWAHPHYRGSHPRLNSLGMALLQALLASRPGQAVVPIVTSIEVKTQVDHIDVLARVNDEKCNGIVLVIEDKVGTHEHSKQIERYVETAQRKYSGRMVVPVYVKTMNASQQNLPPREQCGRFLRDDFLKVLRGYCDTGDTIVDNYRLHLENLEERTNSYLHTPPDKWDWWPITGFYTALERLMPQESQGDSPHWGYASNPAGGVLWFAFAGSSVAREPYKPVLYLSIEDATRLTVRLGGGQGIRAPFMYEALRLLEESASRAGDFQDHQIKKAGRFRGGGTAAVAEVGFEPGDSYLALSDHGLVDMDRTVERLEGMREVVADVAKRLST